jgi:FkbM family methyltransferase
MDTTTAPPVPDHTRTAGPRAGGRLAAAATVLRTLARHAWFMEDEILGLRDLVRPGDVCIDVGAEYGVYTVALAGRVGPRGRVHAIEPQPGPSRALRTAVRLAGADEIVRSHRHALAEREGYDWMSVPRRGGLPVHGRGFLTAGTSAPGPNATDFRVARWQRVEITTLDVFCDREGIERVDFIKADVEGAELKVLHGGVQTLTRHRPALQLEIQEPHIAKYGHHAVDVVALLADLGYALHEWCDGAWCPTDRVTPRRRNYLFLWPKA